MKMTGSRTHLAAMLLTFTAAAVPVAGDAAVSPAPPAPQERASQQPRLPQAPAKLPDDIDRLCPTFPGAVLLQVEKGETQSRAMFKSAATPADIAAHYKKELIARGWTVFKEMSETNSTRLILKKDNEEIGFSAIVQPSKVVTFFISLRRS